MGDDLQLINHIEQVFGKGRDASGQARVCHIVAQGIQGVDARLDNGDDPCHRVVERRCGAEAPARVFATEPEQVVENDPHVRHPLPYGGLDIFCLRVLCQCYQRVDAWLDCVEHPAHRSVEIRCRAKPPVCIFDTEPEQVV